MLIDAIVASRVDAYKILAEIASSGVGDGNIFIFKILAVKNIVIFNIVAVLENLELMEFDGLTIFFYMAQIS